MIGIVIWEVRGTLANTWGIAHLASHSRHVPLGPPTLSLPPLQSLLMRDSRENKIKANRNKI
jgi:hypothetical protein